MTHTLYTLYEQLIMYKLAGIKLKPTRHILLQKNFQTLQFEKLDLATLRKTVKRPNLLFDDPVGGAKDLLQHPLLVVQQCRRHHHPPSALPLQKI